MGWQTIQGVIRRRMLVNFCVEPEVIRRVLPAKFHPKLHKGFAIAGICLIRLEQMRPKYVPALFGASSENAAHRIAVLWEGEDGQTQEGVFIVRRDTNSVVNTIAGGRLFPGEYHRANFQVTDSKVAIDFKMKSDDAEVAVRLRAKTTAGLPGNSRFETLEAASGFFEPGALGYSATRNGHRLNGMTLNTKTWRVEPLEVEEVYSSYFSDEKIFPAGAVHFDCALMMRDIDHEWQSEPDLSL